MTNLTPDEFENRYRQSGRNLTDNLQMGFAVAKSGHDRFDTYETDNLVRNRLVRRRIKRVLDNLDQVAVVLTTAGKNSFKN